MKRQRRKEDGRVAKGCEVVSVWCCDKGTFGDMEGKEEKKKEQGGLCEIRMKRDGFCAKGEGIREFDDGELKWKGD